MFRSALIKLTLSYLAIIMAVSLFFTSIIYRIAGQELGNNVMQQQNVIMRHIGPSDLLTDPEFLVEREQLLARGKQRLLFQLFYTNLAILLFGGGLSYFLAKRTLEPVEEAHQAQAQFTADASHELRSPLAAMKTEIEVALRDPNLTKNEATELLKSNLEELEKLSGLAEGLLTLTRENGMKKESVLVSEIVEKALTEMTKKATEKKIIIENNTSEKIKVYGDKEKLIEVFVIILDNAIKYSGSGTKIIVKTGTDGHFAMVSITDEGIGISPKDQDSVFERFWRADSSRSKNKADGYGLGLSIARKIVDLHQGKIEISSEEGRGSTFRVMIPLAVL